eukprot:11180347-Lingulodinium_polyedra.AAC.1
MVPPPLVASRSERLRTPRARQTTGARVERASVQFARRCNGGRGIRPRRCAGFSQRSTTMRSN